MQPELVSYMVVQCYKLTTICVPFIPSLCTSLLPLRRFCDFSLQELSRYSFGVGCTDCSIGSNDLPYLSKQDMLNLAQESLASRLMADIILIISHMKWQNNIYRGILVWSPCRQHAERILQTVRAVVSSST